MIPLNTYGIGWWKKECLEWLLESRCLTEEVGGLCNPCGSRHVCSSVLAGLCGDASPLEGRVHRWLQHTRMGVDMHMVWPVLWVVSSRVR